jgi:hypothetical protein
MQINGHTRSFDKKSESSKQKTFPSPNAIFTLLAKTSGPISSSPEIANKNKCCKIKKNLGPAELARTKS